MTDLKYYQYMEQVEKEFEPVFKELEDVAKKYGYIIDIIKKRAVNWARARAEDYFDLPEETFKKIYKSLLQMSIKHGIVWFNEWLRGISEGNIGVSPEFLKEAEERLKSKFNIIL